MSGSVEGKNYDALCRLIAAWVNGVPMEITETPDYEALFLAADRHGLTAAACAALEQTGLMAQCPIQTARRFQEKKAQSIRKTMLMDAEREALLDFFEKSGVWYLPLKGAMLSGAYPQYGTRQFADNDILFDPARWREVRDFMKRRGYKVKSVGKQAHDTYHKPPVYNFELHRRLFMDEKNPFLTAAADYYDDVKERLIKDEGNRFGYHFRDEDFYAYFLAHSYMHWEGNGTGLRTVLDVYLYRRARPDMDGAYIAGELQKLGLTEFEALFRALGEKLFGPAPAPALTGAEQKALAWLERAGMYGTLERSVQNNLRRLQGGEGPTGGRTRTKYLLRRVFPDREWYRINAPFVYRHGWVKPFFWVYRLGRGVFVNGKRNLRILREVCFPREGKSIIRLGAEKIKRLISRPFQKPISQWPLEKQITKAMQDYERREGHTFDLAHPALFTEKRLWYALFFEHPDLTQLYDKYLFKGYIEEKLGHGWTAPLYGAWTSVRDLKRDWDSLPDCFCLKSNCSSLGKNVVFVRDKSSTDKKALFRAVKKWLDPMNTGINSYNRAYNGVTPRIMAEKLLTGNGDQLYDYKIMCFGGKPDHIMATADRFPLERGALNYTFYDLSWNKLPITTPGYRNADIPKPQGLNTMIRLAEKVSQGFPFVRVDFYDTVDGVIAGEMTLYPSPNYDQKDWDLKLGEKFILPNEVKHGHQEDAGENKPARYFPVA